MNPTPLENQAQKIDRSPEETKRRLTRDPSLAVAAEYRRTIHASLERVWENVYDWEHLPWLHASSFDAIDSIDSGSWGWHALVRFPGGEMQSEIELVADKAAGRYVARTLDGVADGEVWTQLTPSGANATDIVVEFCVAAAPSEQLEVIGQGYLGLYATLWDEDEFMMQKREEALGETRSEADPSPLDLGSYETLRARLPLDLRFGGRPYRLVELAGELVVYSSRCPHTLGPLDGPIDSEGKIVCPWHGYGFDVRSGKSCDGHKLRLAPPPEIDIDSASGSVTLRRA